MSRRAGFQWLAAGLVIGWCILFLRGETTEKSIVRVMLLEQIYRSYRIMNHEPYHK